MLSFEKCLISYFETYFELTGMHLGSIMTIIIRFKNPQVTSHHHQHHPNRVFLAMENYIIALFLHCQFSIMIQVMQMQCLISQFPQLVNAYPYTPEIEPGVIVQISCHLCCIFLFLLHSSIRQLKHYWKKSISLKDVNICSLIPFHSPRYCNAVIINIFHIVIKLCPLIHQSKEMFRSLWTNV